MQAVAAFCDSPIWTCPENIQTWMRGIIHGHPLIADKDCPIDAASPPDELEEVRPDACILGGEALFERLWNQVDTLHIAVPDQGAVSPFPEQLDRSIWKDTQYLSIDNFSMYAMWRHP